MTYFLLFATGAKLLEKTMMQRPGYPEYAARTSMFFPLRRRSRPNAGRGQLTRLGLPGSTASGRRR